MSRNHDSSVKSESILLFEVVEQTHREWVSLFVVHEGNESIRQPALAWWTTSQTRGMRVIFIHEYEYS